MAVAKKKTGVGASKTGATKPRLTKAAKAAAAEPAPKPVYVSRYEAGHRVVHGIFGPGEVSEVAVDKLSIRFDDNTTKVILDSFVTPQKA